MTPTDELKQEAAREVLAALQVLTTTPATVAWLTAHDPKALAQARRAVAHARGYCHASDGAGHVCDRPAGHDGAHGAEEPLRTINGQQVGRRCSWRGEAR